MKLLIATLGLLGAAAYLTSQAVDPRQAVGPLPDGRFLLSTGYTLQPAGKQIPLDTLPMSTALSPDGKYLLILNGGYNPPSITVLSTADEKEIARVPVEDGWLGLSFAPGGKMVYVGGGSRASVFEFEFADGKLTPARRFEVTPQAERVHQDFTGDVALSPDGRLIYVAQLYRDTIAVINPQSGRVIDRFKTGRRPYRILFHPDGKSFFVSSWADGSVFHHNAADGSLLKRIPVGPQTTDMVWSDRKVEVEQSEEAPNWAARIFVTASNSNSVHVLSISEGSDIQSVETINVALTPRHPVGMTPSSLALSADQSNSS
jgi:YVTN family beta-propeller protein